MIKYRPHKGSLIEAMKQSMEFTDIAEMFKHIENEWHGMISSDNITIGQSYGPDDRIGWKSYRYILAIIPKATADDLYVCIGMCDLGEKG